MCRAQDGPKIGRVLSPVSRQRSEQPVRPTRLGSFTAAPRALDSQAYRAGLEVQDLLRGGAVETGLGFLQRGLQWSRGILET